MVFQSAPAGEGGRCFNNALEHEVINVSIRARR